MSQSDLNVFGHVNIFIDRHDDGLRSKDRPLKWCFKIPKWLFTQWMHTHNHRKTCVRVCLVVDTIFNILDMSFDMSYCSLIWLLLLWFDSLCYIVVAISVLKGYRGLCLEARLELLMSLFSSFWGINITFLFWYSSLSEFLLPNLLFCHSCFVTLLKLELSIDFNYN